MWKLHSFGLLFIATLFTSMLGAQSVVLDSTRSGLLPGARLGTVHCPPWIVSWYEGMATSTLESSKLVDTLYVSSMEEGWELDTLTDGSVDSSAHFWAQSYRTRSIVGPYVSYEYGYDGSGGAHPVYGGYYRTIELGSKHTVSLDHIFPEADILHALLRNQFLLDHLVDQNPRSLSEVKFGTDDQEHYIQFDSLLVSYAFSDIIGDSVEVDFGLNEEIASSRGGVTTLEIKLRIPPKWRNIFNLAKKNRTLGLGSQ